MSAEALTAKYIEGMEKTLKNMQRTMGLVSVSEKCVDEILSCIQAYLKDAKYYREGKKFETSLTSIAYCEGLFDALKLIGVVKI